MNRVLISLTLLCACARVASAQELTFRTSLSFLTDRTEIRKMSPSVSYPAFDLKLGWKLPRDASYSGAYGEPVGGIGLSYLLPGTMEFESGSRMGNGVSLYGFFTAPIVRSGPFRLEYTLELGGAYLKDPFHPATNPLNLSYGNSLEYYLGGGLAALFRIGGRLSAGVEAGFRHYSSGCWFVPNRGLTSFAPAVDVKYTFSESTRDARRFSIGEGIPEKTLRWGVSVGAGGHQCDGERKMHRVLYRDPEDRPTSYQRYLKGNVGLEVFWRYSRFFATGLSGELLYLSEAKSLKAVDEALYDESDHRYSPLAGGVILLQEIYYRRFAVHGGVGVYLGRHMGREADAGPLYQKLGLRYYTPHLDGAFVGFSVRLNRFVQSDYMEFTVGKHF